MTAVEGWERRLGVRRAVPEALVAWWPRRDQPEDTPEGEWQPPPGAAIASVVQLSVSGALVVAPASATLAPGDIVGMEHNGARGGAVVRRIEPTADPAQRVHSVEFTGTNPALANSLYTLLDQAELEELRAAWLAEQARP